MYGSGRRSAKALLTPFPVQCGFLYLVAIMDWATRHVLAWRLSNTMDTRFCREALNEALARHGRPEIFNTDLGSQFTSVAPRMAGNP
jgi:putative transposase